MNMHRIITGSILPLILMGCFSGGSEDSSNANENVAGKLDSSFGDNGVVGLGNFFGPGRYWDTGYAVTFDENNDIYITGSYDRTAAFENNPQNFDMYVAKLDSLGQLDPAFGAGGIVHYGGDREQRGYDLVISQDGNILVLGMTDNQYGYDNVSLWKYQQNGQLDLNFSADGIVTIPAPSNTTHYKVKRMAIDSQNRIVVAGAIENYDGALDMVLMRFLPNGELDSSFATSGIYTYSTLPGGTGNVQATDLDIDSNDNIVVVGYGVGFINNYDLIVWKFNTDGTLNTQFANNGIFVNCGLCADDRIGENGGVAVTVDELDRILIAGWLIADEYGNTRVIIWRFDEFGDVDSSFGQYGRVIDMNEMNNIVDIELDHNNKIIVAARGRGRNGWPDMLLFRYNENGSLDGSFGVAGKKVYAEVLGDCCVDIAIDLNIDYDGNYFLIGNSDRQIGNVSSSDIALIKAVQ